LESSWRQNVPDQGIAILGARKAARLLGIAHPVWVLDVIDEASGSVLLVTAPYPPIPPGLPEYWTAGYAVPPAGVGSRFPYGYSVAPDGPP
jgi:hypothetical protein